MDNRSVLERFDGELFGRLIEKIMVTSLVEVTFIFKTEVEVREVLGGLKQRSKFNLSYKMCNLM